MDTRIFLDKLRMICSLDDIGRLQIKGDENTVDVVVDVHGMKCVQARRFLNNIIALMEGAFRVIVIHGYNHGTAIKDMLADNFNNKHIMKRLSDPYNHGVTYLLCA